MSGSPFNALLTSAGTSAAGQTSGADGYGFGPTFYVNANRASDGNGKTWKSAFKYMASAFSALNTMNTNTAKSADNANIFVIGTVAEQLLAPLGVSGVKIIGVNGGNNRHDNGARWKENATAAAAPLLELREQGWEVHHMLMVPQTGYSAIKLHREESATYPDASHFVADNIRFMGNAALGTAAGIGIEDYGGQYNVSVDGCRFINLIDAIKMTNASIASPLMWRVGVDARNIFQLNTNDISTNGSGWVVMNNEFMTPYNVTTHPITLNLAFTGTTTYANRVAYNDFADAAANVVIAKGYVKGNTSDVWRNTVTDTAAYIVTVPS